MSPETNTTHTSLATAEARVKPETPPKDRRPSVIVDDVHVVYKVYASGTRVKPNQTQRKLLKRGPNLRRAREIHAVKGISFTAYEGESIGIIGANGSGKSTLLRTIAGLQVPEKGAVYVDTEPTLLGVNAALIPDLSGEKNIVLGCLALGLSPAEVEARYDAIADFSGIREILEFPMRTYSSGQGARLRFSIAASVEHRVLLVDEALAVGDAEFQRRSEARIRELREGAGTVFHVSHSLSSVVESCDRTIWIDNGVMRMDGETEEVVDAYKASVE